MFDLSGERSLPIYVANDAPTVQLTYQPASRVPFPPKTFGFFYYHRAPDMPELAGGIRFRICREWKQFDQGRDLLDSAGSVWDFKIWEIVKHTTRQGFLSLLISENLVDQSLINDIKNLDLRYRGPGRSVLYSLSEPFIMDFARPGFRLRFITRKALVRLSFEREMFNDLMKQSRYLFTAFIKVRFELSDLPEHKDLGPTLVLRVLDIVDPIAGDPVDGGSATFPLTKPGTLLRQNQYGKDKVVCFPISRQPMGKELLEFVKSAPA